MLQLASMVALPERVDRYDPPYQQPVQPLMQNHMRAQEPFSFQNTASVTPVSSTYSVPVQRRYDYGYATQNPTMASNAPPSPPGEDVKHLSLPSISSLLEISDAKQGDQQTLQQSQIPVSQQSQQPQLQIPSHHSTPVVPSSGEYARNDSLAQSYAHSGMTGRISLPSTPPLMPDGPMEGNQSPSTVSTHSVPPHQTYYLNQPVTSVDSQQRSSFAEPHIPKRLSITSQPTVHPYPTPTYTPTTQYGPAAFVSSPTAMSGSPYYSENHILPSSSLYSQRPLPSNFPPTVTVLPFASPPSAGTTNPWQHHHYISASSQSTFPPSQDRYVCQTCNKAFSRPSSLRIHSHSHTGEKPFKCSHAGCGKAFSVRSNMKRHERGCHAGTNSAVGAS